jgi:hypothetical protein
VDIVRYPEAPGGAEPGSPGAAISGTAFAE